MKIRSFPFSAPPPSFLLDPVFCNESSWPQTHGPLEHHTTCPHVPAIVFVFCVVLVSMELTM